MNESSAPKSAVVSSGVGLSHIATGAGINFVGTFFRAALSFAFSLLISRVLPLNELGLFTLGFTIVLLLQYFCTMGMDSGLWRYVAAYNAKGDLARLRGSILGALYLATPVSIVVTALVVIMAQPIATGIFREPDFAGSLRVFAITIPFLVTGRLFIAATQGLQHMKYAAVRDMAEQALRFVLTGALFVAGYRLGGALAANAIAFATVTVMSFYFLERVLPMFRDKSRSIVQLGTLVKFSLPMGASLILTHLILWNDTLFLGYFTSSEDVGLYSVAIRLITVAAIIQTSFNTMFAPIISDLYTRGLHGELEQIFKRVTRWIITLSLPIFLPLLLFGPQVLLIFGERFTVIATSLAILAFGQLVNVSTGPVGGMICMCDRPRLETINSTFAWILSIGLCVILIPRYGILGAAIANASATGLVNIIRALEVKALFGVHAYNAEYLKPAMAALGAGGLSYLGIKTSVAGSGLFALGVWAAAFLAIYVLVIYMLGFEKTDVEMAQAVKMRLFHS